MRFKSRFFIIMAVLLIILLAPVADKFKEAIERPKVTSIYWQEVCR